MKEIIYEPPAQNEAGKESPLNAPKGGVVFTNPPVRTFKADVSELLERTNTTKLDIVMAEKAHREERWRAHAEEGHQGSHLGRAIFILALLFAFGVGVGAYALIGATIPIPFLSSKNERAGETTKPAGGVVNITDSPRAQILVDIALLFEETRLADGGSRPVQFTVADAGGKTREATAAELLTALGENTLSQDLLRSLGADAMYEIRSANGLSGTLRLHSRAYPETFSGMLAWEPKMAEVLIPVFRPNIKKGDVALLRERLFKDERIGEINVRVLSDPAGDSALAYAFPDQETLIIAGGRDALRVLIEQSRSKVTK